MDQTVEKNIADATFVLVGIGQEMAWKREKNFAGEEAWLNDYETAIEVESAGADNRLLRAYEKLAGLLKGKLYFIVTMNTDDLIYRSSLNKEQIAVPCGSVFRLQCEDHIFEGKKEIARIKRQLEEGKTGGEIAKPVCPICQKEAVPNTVKSTGYLEEGYLPDWERYRRWLSCTMNQKLCILELGVGFQYPTVIRWPFEKTAFLNKKSSFVRVHSRLFQISEELKEKAVSVPKHAADFLLEG